LSRLPSLLSGPVVRFEAMEAAELSEKDKFLVWVERRDKGPEIDEDDLDASFPFWLFENPYRLNKGVR